MRNVYLEKKDCRTATDIQRAVDVLSASGGVLHLPEVEVELDRAIELRSGITISGHGPGTVLRSAASRVFPLDGFQVYGMYDVFLTTSEGLKPGMTVSIRDDQYENFFETFARITWIDGNRIGLDQPLASDYGEPGSNPRLTNSFPLIFGSNIQNAAVKKLRLDGNRRYQEEGIGSCRGAALYFIRSSDCRIEEVQESSFPGEGLAFQMCSRMQIEVCSFVDNTGNGFHPGAGSTAAAFRSCVAEDNGRCGFFFCARANHIDVEDCQFRQNQEAGVSVGILDCHNRIITCTMSDNFGPGILFRPEVRPTEVHSCEISACTITGNRGKDIRGQIDIRGEAHDLVFADNRISSAPSVQTAGIAMDPACIRIFLQGNRFEGCAPEVKANPESLTPEKPRITAGWDSAIARHFRHLFRDPQFSPSVDR
jgi:hypothetical protein